MIPVRIRLIQSCRTEHVCEDCERIICYNETCVEISWYEFGRMWSTYTCCRPFWKIKKGNFPKVNKEDFCLMYEEVPF